MATLLQRDRQVVLLAAAFVLLASNLTAQETRPSETPPCVEPTFKYPDHMVHPGYPKESLGADEDTSVELRVVVAPDGRITEPLPHNGDNPYVSAAIHAVRKWHFYPVEVDGHAAATTYRVHIHFDASLQEGVPTGVELESPQPGPSPALLLARGSLAEEFEEHSGEKVHESSEQGVVAPKALYSPEPEFSEKARQAKEQGTVTLVLIVGTDGLPRNVRVACSSQPDLNENALEALNRWRFSPGTIDGRPVPVALLVDVSFKLN